MKPPNFTFYGGRGHTTTNLPSSFWTSITSLRIQPQEKSPAFDILSGPNRPFHCRRRRRLRSLVCTYSLNHKKISAQVGRGRACLKVGWQINQYSVAKRRKYFFIVADNSRFWVHACRVIRVQLFEGRLLVTRGKSWSVFKFVGSKSSLQFIFTRHLRASRHQLVGKSNNKEFALWACRFEV